MASHVHPLVQNTENNDPVFAVGKSLFRIKKMVRGCADAAGSQVEMKRVDFRVDVRP